MANIDNHATDGAASDGALPGCGGGDSLEGSAENDRLTGGGVSRQIDDSASQSALAATLPITSGATSQL